MFSRSTRRELLRATSSLGALTLASRVGFSASEGPSAEFFEISLAQWSNHRTLRAGQTNLEWISAVREKYDIGAVEFVNQFFADKACDWDYLSQMKLRASDAGVRMLLIMIDGEGALAAEDKSEREAAIEKHRKWIVAAGYLGCHSIRVNAAGSGDEDEMAKRAADSLTQLARFGEQYKINVIVENHGGLSSSGAWLASVMRLADHPGVGTLPDFGNFRVSRDVMYDRYLGVKELMPYAKAVSAKSHDFDKLGNETNTDYNRMLRIVKDSGYTGFIGVEYEGSNHSEDDGIRLTRDLLIRTREELS
ncbi:MAG: L-ribulose-5-phosphate 3-epimerase [Planctomycetota bacterium]|jgi:L-ribulose-5-phosphate 3-epimerase